MDESRILLVGPKVPLVDLFARGVADFNGA